MNADQCLQGGINEAGILHLSIGINTLAKLGKCSGDAREFARECLEELSDIVEELSDDSPIKRARGRFTRKR